MADPQLSSPPSWQPLAVLLAGAGVLHFVLPKPFEDMVPKALGAPGPWVKVSGVIELAVAAGLAVPATRRFAGLMAAGLFVAVYPANLEMTRKAMASSAAGPLWKSALIARLPLQLPLVVRSLRLARGR